MKKIQSLALLLATVTAGFTADAPRDLVVHEWGTFTDVQGGDGKLISWQAQQIGDLPGFVYNWMRPGRGRQTPTILTFGKGGLAGLQRMETPVIYFYSDKEFDADVTVKFPGGHITEWFPQADEVGAPGLVAKAAATVTRNPTGGNLIRWQNLRVLPAKPNAALAARMPTSTNGTHYFAARETDSAFLRAHDASSTNLPVQYEKFLFYRGTGDFKTPLTVTTTDDGAVSVHNTGVVPLGNLFLLNVKDGAAEWTQLGKLPAGARQPWQKLNSTARVPQAEFQKQIGDAMAAALTDAGLFPAEAKAMVKTWSKSWFAEEGARVLYILPRGWTDETLPLTLNPKPRQLVRVMVGRAEIITPALQKEIVTLMKLNQTGDKVATDILQAHWVKLGRFAGPAARLASQQLEKEKDKPVAAADKSVARAEFE
ncbi:MAG: hypothetical protein EXS35_14820 [Pedosphaera sp.]|nr:hypothetical protein [Pedosphaera sp.]